MPNTFNEPESIKYKTIRTINNKITSMKNNLHNETSFIDYVHLITKLLVSNDQNISKICKNQGKKLHNFFLKNFYHNSVTSHDSNQDIFNFWSHDLNSTEKSLPSKELSLAIPPKNKN